MSKSFKTIHFNEDHCPGQRIVQRYNHTSDYQDFWYVDEHGECHRLFGGSDSMISGLVALINNNEGTRNATTEEEYLSNKSLF